jgi:hypothetical protein
MFTCLDKDVSGNEDTEPRRLIDQLNTRFWIVCVPEHVPTNAYAITLIGSDALTVRMASPAIDTVGIAVEVTIVVDEAWLHPPKKLHIRTVIVMDPRNKLEDGTVILPNWGSRLFNRFSSLAAWVILLLDTLKTILDQGWLAAPVEAERSMVRGLHMLTRLDVINRTVGIETTLGLWTDHVPTLTNGYREQVDEIHLAVIFLAKRETLNPGFKLEKNLVEVSRRLLSSSQEHTIDRSDRLNTSLHENLDDLILPRLVGAEKDRVADRPSESIVTFVMDGAATARELFNTVK